MANNRYIFAIIICFFAIATIPAKTTVQTPILSKIYAITKKSIPTPLFSKNSFKPLERPNKEHNLIRYQMY